MKRIWKYKIPIGESSFQLEIPRGARFLHYQMIDGQPRMWLMVDPDEPRERATFGVVMTGEPFSDRSAIHLATYVFGISQEVHHLFQIVPELAKPAKQPHGQQET